MPVKTESQLILTNSVDADSDFHKMPWWSQRTKLEKRCFVLSGLLTIVVFCLIVSIVIMKGGTRYMFGSSEDEKDTYSNGEEDPNICLTKGCIQAASDILGNIDETADPCDDFYQFACGGFIKRTSIPDDKTKATMFSVIGDKVNEQVRSILDETNTDEDPRPYQLAKSYFQSCMDKNTLEEIGVTPLQEILQRIGGWPVTMGDSWDGTTFHWFEMVYKFREIGFSVDYLVDFSVSVDQKNSSWRTMDLDQPSTGLAREYLIKGLMDDEVQAYYTFMKETAVMMGANENDAEAQMLEVLKFEMALANISSPMEERRNSSKLYNPMKIQELQDLDPNTPWLEYVKKILLIDSVSEDDIIIVDEPSYVRNFSSLISQTPAQVQANYLIWRAVAFSLPYLSDEADKIRLKLSKKITGQTEQPPRWIRCVEEVKDSLPNTIGSLYVKKYFDENSKKKAKEMVAEIRNQFNKILDKVDWMDTTTREKAKEKAKAMETHIAYPSELLDISKLETLLEGLDVKDGAYFQNALKINTLVTNYYFNKLREKVNKTDWVQHGHPAVVNAFYSPLENSISFPAGILQGVFFSSDRPQYLNYGAIGWVIGHEITHGFDDRGRQFDLKGDLVDWWLPDTKAKFLNKTDCIIKQYSNYTVTGDLHVNGVNTQGENIADNGGIKEAYHAYVSWTEQNGPEKHLPGLDFSPRQLFWLSAANVWCSKIRPEAMKKLVKTGVHSPPQFRVKGTFSNMEEFSKDFNCPVGTAMNPKKEEKCQVW